MTLIVWFQPECTNHPTLQPPYQTIHQIFLTFKNLITFISTPPFHVNAPRDHTSPSIYLASREIRVKKVDHLTTALTCQLAQIVKLVILHFWNFKPVQNFWLLGIRFIPFLWENKLLWNKNSCSIGNFELSQLNQNLCLSWKENQLHFVHKWI